jgi:hypothetical protein
VSVKRKRPRRLWWATDSNGKGGTTSPPACAGGAKTCTRWHTATLCGVSSSSALPVPPEDAGSPPPPPPPPTPANRLMRRRRRARRVLKFARLVFFFPARRRSKRRLGGASGEGGLGLWWVGLPFAGFYLLWACCLPSQICGLGVCSLVWAWAFVLKVLNCAGNSDFFFVFEKKRNGNGIFVLCSVFTAADVGTWKGEPG